MFIHPPGDEMWLSFVAFPHDMSYFLLSVNNSNGISSTDVALLEKEIVLRNKDSAPCKFYNEQVISSNHKKNIFYVYVAGICKNQELPKMPRKFQKDLEFPQLPRPSINT